MLQVAQKVDFQCLQQRSQSKIVVPPLDWNKDLGSINPDLHLWVASEEMLHDKLTIIQYTHSRTFRFWYEFPVIIEKA